MLFSFPAYYPLRVLKVCTEGRPRDPRTPSFRHSDIIVPSKSHVICEKLKI